MFGFLGSLVSTALGGVMNLFGQQSANDASAAQSATRYQTASQDMIKAGLNPAMMFGSGSAAPMPQNQNVMAGPASAIQSAISNAMQMMQLRATVDNLDAATAAKRADARNMDADTLNKAKEGGLIDARTASEKMNPLLKMSQASALDAAAGVDVQQKRILHNKAVSAQNQEDMDPDFRKLLDQAGFAGQNISDIVSPVASSAKMLNMMMQ